MVGSIQGPGDAIHPELPKKPTETSLSQQTSYTPQPMSASLVQKKVLQETEAKIREQEVKGSANKTLSISDKKQAVLANLPPIYKKMLTDLEAHTKKIASTEGPIAAEEFFKAAKQTIEGIAILQAFREEISATKDQDLQNLVNDLTGLGMHADLGLANKQALLNALTSTSQLLSNTFNDSITDKEKELFFNNTLSGKGCMEMRFNQITNFGMLHKTLNYQLKNELEDYKKSNPGLTLVDDFLPHLRKKNFFDKNKMTEAEFLQHPILAELEKLELLFKKPPPLEPLEDRIMGELFSSTHVGKGEQAFKKYILDNFVLTDSERKNIDAVLEDFWKNFESLKENI